jgi:hypothetical protein
MIVLSLLAKSIIHESHHSAAVFFRLSSSSSTLGRNIFLRNLPVNSFEVSISLIVIDQFPQPYQMTGKIIILYILVFNFSTVDVEINILNGMDEFNPLLIYKWIRFPLLIIVVSRYLNFPDLLTDLLATFTFILSDILLARHECAIKCDSICFFSNLYICSAINVIRVD